MSQNTQIEVMPQHITIQGEELLAVDRFLGVGGTAMLRETLTELDNLRTQFGAATPLLDWQRQSQDVYTTRVGVAQVELNVSKRLASVSYREERVVYASTVPEQRLAPATRAAIHARINQLVAVTVAQKIAQKLEERMRVVQHQPQRVTLSALNQSTVRAHVKIQNAARVGYGRG